MSRPSFVGVVDLSDEEYLELTLHNFNARSEVLREIAAEWDMTPNSSLIVVNRCPYKRRFREIYMDYDGILWVKMCEHDDNKLSVELATSEIYQRRVRNKEQKEVIKRIRDITQRRIDYRKKRAAKKRDR